MHVKLLLQKGLILVTLMTIATGCLSPATIRPVAEQNSNNISNYNGNVAAVVNALRREAVFHGEIEIQIVRNKLAKDLIQLPQSWLGKPDPTSQDLSDPSQEPYKSLYESVSMAGDFRIMITDDRENKEVINTILAAKYPLAADIVLETPGFTIIRVINDAFTLKKLNEQIISETSTDVISALMQKRNRLLAPYLSVRIQKDLVQTYLEALEGYLSIVIEQGQVAASHANSISAYANARPQVSTLASALQDQELRNGVLDLVKKKKGEDYSKRVENYLNNAYNIIEVLRDLSM